MTGTVSSPEVDLHESLLARNATPSPLQVVRVSSLALVCETRGDLEIEHFADVNGEVGASPPRCQPRRNLTLTGLFCHQGI